MNISGSDIRRQIKEDKLLILKKYEDIKDPNYCAKEIINLFEKYHLYEYIKKFYEVLHVTGPKYIVEDIELYIKFCQIVSN